MDQSTSSWIPPLSPTGAGQVLYRRGEALGGVWYLAEGVIRVVAIDDAGHELTLFRLQAPALLVHDFCLSSPGPALAGAIVERHSVLGFVAGKDVPVLLDTRADFRALWLAAQEAATRSLVDLASSLAFASVEQRLHGWLATKCIAGVRRLTVTHQELANHLGTSREVVSRILKDWEGQGAVDLGRGTIVLTEGFRQLRP